MVLSLSPLVLVVALASAPAVARRSAPDEGWIAFPEGKAGPRPALPPLRRPLPPGPHPRPSARSPVELALPSARAAPAKPVEPNQVSLYSAQTLAPGQRGLGGYLGFPLLGVRAGLGISGGLDLGLSFESFWGSMNEARAHARLELMQRSRWTGALVLEGGVALFTQRASTEDHGARWLTGHRNYNVMPGLVFSYRGESPRASRLFFDVRYHLAFDTEPFHRNPLGGVPPAWELGHNFPIRSGAELRLTARTSLLFVLGLDVHGRSEDAALMPVCSVGLVSAI